MDLHQKAVKGLQFAEKEKKKDLFEEDKEKKEDPESEEDLLEELLDDMDDL